MDREEGWYEFHSILAALERTSHYTAIDYREQGWGEQRYEGPEGTISREEMEALHPREDLFSEEDYRKIEEDLPGES